MMQVIRQINIRKRELGEHPFLQFLRNDSVGAEPRMSFAPCMAPFVMGFADVNIHGLRDELSGDHLQRLVNDHIHEDDHHWPMYLDDPRVLGSDFGGSLSPTLEWLWDDNRNRTRTLPTA